MSESYSVKTNEKLKEYTIQSCKNRLAKVNYYFFIFFKTTFILQFNHEILKVGQNTLLELCSIVTSKNEMHKTLTEILINSLESRIDENTSDVCLILMHM